MITLLSVDNASHRCLYYHKNGSGHRGHPDLVGMYIFLDEPPKTVARVYRNTGLLRQGGRYSDSRQENNSVVHKHIDGTITSSDLATDGDGFAKVDNDGNLVQANLGYYVNYQVVPPPSAWSKNNDFHYCQIGLVDKTDDRYFIAITTFSRYAEPGTYRFLKTNSKDSYSFGCNWSQIDLTHDAKDTHYDRGGTANTGTRYGWSQMPYNAAIEEAKAFLALQSWSHRNDGRGKRSTYTTTMSFKGKPFAISDASLYNGIRHLLEYLPVYQADQITERELYSQTLDGQSCFSGNAIAYVSDLKSTGDSIRSVLGLIANPESPKAWANAWLSCRFGDKLTVQDSKEIIHSVKSELKSMNLDLGYKETRAQAGFRLSTDHSPCFDSITGTARARLRCSNESLNALMTSVKKLMEWDAWPTLENTWDLIPLSFVVDWFLDLSSILSSIDRLVYEQYLQVRFYERSDKVEITFKPEVIAKTFGISDHQPNVDVRGSTYYRRNAPRPQLGILDGWDPCKPTAVNGVDAASLLVQMRY